MYFRDVGVVVVVGVGADGGVWNGTNISIEERLS